MLDRRYIAQCRMQTPGVVEALDVLDDAAPSLLPGLESDPFEQLGLQAREERLGHRVVVAASHLAHRPADPPSGAKPSKRRRGVRRSLVRMMDQTATFRLPAIECATQAGHRQLGRVPRAHRVAHDPTRGHVQRHRQIQHALGRVNVRRVRDPDPIRCRRRELAPQPIRGSLATAISFC